MVSRKAKLRTEAPVNGGRNYNGPKVIDVALVKSGYMLEHLSISRYSSAPASQENGSGSDNALECRQSAGKIVSRQHRIRNPQRLHARGPVLYENR